MINIFVIDDHSIFIDGVYTVLSKYKNKINIVGSATNAKDALENLQSLTVDMVLQDLLMPVVNGAECCRMIKETYPEIKVIALTGELNPVLLHEAWKNGIDSIVLKGSGSEELYKAILEVSKGRRFFSNGLPEFIFPVKECISETLPNITAREREVLLCLAVNPNRKQAADKLCLSTRGLQFHISNLMIKFETSNLKELLSKARELNYVK